MNKYYKIYNKINDVTLRNTIKTLSKSDKNILIEKLIYSNIRNIEIGLTTVTELDNLNTLGDIYKIRPSNFSTFIPYKNFNELNKYNTFDNLSKLNLVTSCSESFLNINMNMTLDDNISKINKILNKTNLECKIYILSCFNCEFEGKSHFGHYENINRIFTHFSDNPKVTDIILTDTIGINNIKQIDKYMKLYGSSNKVGLHLHKNYDDQNIYYIINTYIEKISLLDSSLNSINNNISTYKLAKVINKITNNEIYDLEYLLMVEKML